MSVELTTKFAPQTDELFKAESKISLLTNTDFDWSGAHSVKLYKISTTPLNDYSRNRSTAPEDSSESLSRYGQLLDLNATTEELLLKHDRSFIFNVDHPSATVAPVKLEDFGIHNDTPLSSGSIVTGRICYDAFVLDNKKIGIYYQATT